MSYDPLTTMRINPTKIERIRKKVASMTLTLEDFTVFLLISPLEDSTTLLSEEELDAEQRGTATSQNDLVIRAGACSSGSKIVETSDMASIDNNSTK